MTKHHLQSAARHFFSTEAGRPLGHTFDNIVTISPFQHGRDEGKIGKCRARSMAVGNGLPKRAN